jgi:hypothetical protein
MKVYYLIYSYSLIPEVILFKRKDDLEREWISFCVIDGEDTADEAAKSFKDGWAEWHDVELRWGAGHV